MGFDFKVKLSMVVLVLFFAISYAAQDPELEKCKLQCGLRRESDREKTDLCVQRCGEYYRQKYDPGREPEPVPIEGEGEGEEEEQENPYVFEEQHYFTGMETEHGRLRILPKFSHRSTLFRGIENYRFAVMEAEQQTFVVPNYWDADVVCFVVQGGGTLNLVRPDGRESVNLRKGDVFRLKAGTTVYMTHTERTVVAKLILPMSTTPGHFQNFFGAGGRNPESFFRAFSDNILEAAFNTRKERVKRIFSEQQRGMIQKASPEQVRAMSHHEGGSLWPFGGKSESVRNIYRQRPTYANQYGHLHELDSQDFKELRDLDVAVSVANITQGGMTAPTVSTKATTFMYVMDGEGYFEMACPRRRTSIPSYRRVSSRLTRGTVTIIPAGRPFTAVASRDRNLSLLCFEVNAFDSEKYPLAGKRSVLRQIEKEAKELAFGIPATEVDEVLNSQGEEYFFRGPQGRGKADA